MIMVGGKWIITLYVLCICPNIVTFSFAFVKERGSRDILDSNALPIAAPPTVLPPIDLNAINGQQPFQNPSLETTTTTIATPLVVDSIHPLPISNSSTQTALPPISGLFSPDQIKAADVPSLLTLEPLPLPTTINSSLNNHSISEESVELLPIRAFPLSEQTTIATPILEKIPSLNNLTSQTNSGIPLPTVLPPIKGIFINEQIITSNSSLDDIISNSTNTNITNPSTTISALVSSLTLQLSSTTLSTTTNTPTSTMPIHHVGIPLNNWLQFPPIICPCGCFINRLRNVIQQTLYKKDKSQCFRRGVYANVENHIIDCPCGCVITTNRNTTVSIYPSRQKCLGKPFTASVDKKRIKCHCGCSGKTNEQTSYIIYPDDNCDCDKERDADDCKFRKLFRMMDILPEE